MIDGSEGVEWRVAEARVDYPQAVATMEERIAAIGEGRATELVWLLEHPPLYTAGTSADPTELLSPGRFPVFRTGRGGRFTYHGPGQRIVYVMLDLKRDGGDVRRHVQRLEELAIRTLADFGIRGERRDDRIGVWVIQEGGRESKIAAIGVRVRRWVSYHGLALNVRPDLDHFGGIVPCGISDHGVTSIEALGAAASMAEVDAALMRHFPAVFGRPIGSPRRTASGDLMAAPAKAQGTIAGADC
jgi:lipoyl(octanoyl) transferase